MSDSDHRHIELSGEQASGQDAQGSTLMPMLIVGLVLIVIGAITIMIFV
ncbi:hypothetical protein ACFPLB_16220 [Aquamicrobium segne]|uniref:Uncharacterized protein n=1 Tax=Aquamicrobium segne TaxID=469547 RepID=A0ABW0H276_9HYPH